MGLELARAHNIEDTRLIAFAEDLVRVRVRVRVRVGVKVGVRVRLGLELGLE